MYYASSSNGTVAAIGCIVAIVIGVIGGIALYFTFLSKKNENKFKGFLGWMYDFLSFKKMLIENLLRITYLILTITVTLASFCVGNFLVTLVTLLLGNLAVRVCYEFSLVLLLICRNTTEINKKLSNSTITTNVTQEDNV